MKSLDELKELYRALPDKKRYFEFITAALSVPVLITVLLTNINNLNAKPNTQPTPTPTPIIELKNTTPTESPAAKKSVSVDPSPTTIQPTHTPITQCKKEVGPVSILSPREQSTLENNPVCIELSKQPEGYCAIVWSYRINTSPWSDYTDKDICIYNLPAGEKNLEVRVKSIVSGQETLLNRIFTVLGATPTPSMTATSSSTTNP